MLIEHATRADAHVHLVPFVGSVNPEHTEQINCIPMVASDELSRDADDDLENLFVEDFLRKADDFRRNEHVDVLPIEIRLGTVYVYQTRRQQKQYPAGLARRCVTAHVLRNEERRARHDKHFLITFNKNKSVNDMDMFEHELTCAGFRASNEQQLSHRLYLRHQNKRLILELTRTNSDRRFFSVKRLLKYSSKYTHIDVVKAKAHSHSPDTFDDVFDIRTSIGKAVDEEELHINDDECNFLHAKDLDQCVFETHSATDGQPIYQFSRRLLPYFDFFQIKQTNTFDYSCVNSRFFGVRIIVEHQSGYDLRASSKTTTPCLQTSNVIMAKLLSFDFTDEEARRIWTIGAWLSDVATRCTVREPYAG